MDSPVVIPRIELLETEGFASLRFPEAQRISGIDVVAQDSHIAGNTVNHLGRNPAHPIATLLVGVSFGMTTETHFNGCLRTSNLPGIAETQPFVGSLHLPTILNHLAKDAEFVADTIADCWYLEGGEGIHVARSQPSQSTVP